MSHNIYYTHDLRRFVRHTIPTIVRALALVSLLFMVATCRATFSEVTVLEPTYGPNNAGTADK